MKLKYLKEQLPSSVSTIVKYQIKSYSDQLPSFEMQSMKLKFLKYDANVRPYHSQARYNKIRQKVAQEPCDQIESINLHVMQLSETILQYINNETQLPPNRT